MSPRAATSVMRPGGRCHDPPSRDYDAVMMGIFHGIRVLDFGRYVAGPWCAALLGDLGAEVIRIDKRGGSEDRFIGPVADGGEGALFLQVNRNKKSLTLDPATPAGREVVRRLVA